MTSRARLRILIDGGGTHVRAALWSDATEIAREIAGPGNALRVGELAARASIAEALVALVRRAPEAAAAGAACVGLAGRSHPEVRSLVANAFADAGVAVEGAKVLVTDAELVLWAAFGAAAPSGVVVVAGTGSIALARTEDGGLGRAGGHGPVLGDEGGGHWIGVEALKTALHRLEEAAGGTRARPSILIDELHVALHGESLAVIPALVAKGVVKPSTIAPVVVRAAERGDRDADDILHRAGVELARLVTRAATSAGLHGAFLVRGAGGVFTGAARVVGALRTELKIHRPEASLGEEGVDPLAGAAALLDHETRPGAHGAKRVPPGW